MLRSKVLPFRNDLCVLSASLHEFHPVNCKVGDLFTTLIHSCQFFGANSFDYLTELLRHAGELTADPASRFRF